MKKIIHGMFLFPALVLSQVSYIVKTSEPSEFHDFSQSQDLKIQPLISYPDPSPEVMERFDGFFLISVESESAEDLISQLPGVTEIIPDHRNLNRQIVEEQHVTLLPALNPQDTVLYNYHIPSDTFFYRQWCKIITQTHWAWELTTGSKDIVVAILDTGIDTLHEDLVANYVGGYDFVETSESIQDVYGHGTSVSGVIAAEIDNGLGIAGISQSSIMMLKVVDDDSYYANSDLIEGIYYAADNGADIISMSLVGDENAPITLIQDAINYAWDKGCFLVAIAGNRGGFGSVYPGAYEQVMSIGSTTEDDERADHSNYGEGVNIYAPGLDIYSPAIGDKYRSRDGTSMAGPQVAGLAALVWSYYPEFTNQEIWDRIIESADTIEINAGQGLRMNSRRALDIIEGSGEEEVQSYPVTVTIINNEIFELPCHSFSSAQYRLTLFDVSGRRVAVKRGYADGKIDFDLGNLTQGVYFWNLETGTGETAGKLILKRD